MKYLLIISGLVMILAFSIYWMTKEPKELYNCDLYAYGGGLTTQSGITLCDDNTFQIYRYGCFNGYDFKGTYSISNDTLYIDNLEGFKDFYKIQNLAEDSVLKFISCDSLNKKKLSFVLAEKVSR